MGPFPHLDILCEWVIYGCFTTLRFKLQEFQMFPRPAHALQPTQQRVFTMAGTTATHHQTPHGSGIHIHMVMQEPTDGLRLCTKGTLSKMRSSARGLFTREAVESTFTRAIQSSSASMLMHMPISRLEAVIGMRRCVSRRPDQVTTPSSSWTALTMLVTRVPQVAT